MRPTLTIFTELQYVHAHSVCWICGRRIATHTHTYIHTFIGTAIFSYEWLVWGLLRLAPVIDAWHLGLRLSYELHQTVKSSKKKGMFCTGCSPRALETKVFFCFLLTTPIDHTHYWVLTLLCMLTATVLCRSLDSMPDHSQIGDWSIREEKNHVITLILFSHWSIWNQTLVVTVKWPAKHSNSSRSTYAGSCSTCPGMCPSLQSNKSFFLWCFQSLSPLRPNIITML